MLLTRIDNRSFASVNAWLEDTTSSTSFVTEKDMDSPKRTADYHTEEIRTPKRMQIFTDPDDTPRNTSLFSHDSVESLDSPATPTDSNMRSSKSNQSGRTNSIKNLSCLLMTKCPVKLSDNISEIPSMGQDLYKELFMCGQGQGILPSASKEEIITAIGMKDLQMEFMWTNSDDSINRHVELSKVKEILSSAQKCRALLDTEPGWNEAVHSRVLKLAVKGQKRVGFQNITTAKIFPSSLNPITSKGTRMGGRMVDYALCLEEDCTEPTFTRMLSAMELETPDCQYINQTSFESVRYRPIVVSIETKVAGNENEATTQLSIWAVAHFKRLQKIMQRSGVVSEMPVLPLINVQGDEWFTRLAVQKGKETNPNRIHRHDYWSVPDSCCLKSVSEMGEHEISELVLWDLGGDPNLTHLYDQFSHPTQELAPLCPFPENVLACWILGNVGKLGEVRERMGKLEERGAS